MDLADLRRLNIQRYTDEYFGGNQTDMARKVGKDSTYINAILKGRRNPTNRTVREMEDKLGLQPNTFDTEDVVFAQRKKKPNTTGEGVNVYEYNDQLNPEQFITVPESHMKLSAGNGYAVVESSEIAHHHVFHTSYFKKKGMKPENALIFPIDGDSMRERLQNDDRVMADKGRNILLNGRVFAVLYDNELFIKRIVKNQDGSITLRSDNPSYQPFDRTIASDEIQNLLVLGQILDLIDGSIF